jgi:hypothetical protein
MILELTAKLNQGLCGACKKHQDNTQRKAEIKQAVESWISNPETLPGTHGIPEPKDIALAFAAAQVRTRLYPTQQDMMERLCHEAFGVAHNKWDASGSAQLSDREKYILAVEAFYGEVMNGGLTQYLYNESGAFANWSADAFVAIGIPEYAEVMREVKRLFPDGVIPEDRNQRLNVVSGIDESILEQIENAFWARYSADNTEIRTKLYAFIKG